MEVCGLLVGITMANLEMGPLRIRNTLTQIISSGVVQVSAGYYHSLILKADGSLWAFGGNNNGQLGDGTTAQRNAPIQIISTGVAQVAAGSVHSMILKVDGSLWAFGGNSRGQLGNGTILNKIHQHR